jgi:hypothetical protein
MFLAVASGAFFLSQVRMRAAHPWESQGEPVTVTQQYFESVDVPPPGLLPGL